MVFDFVDSGKPMERFLFTLNLEDVCGFYSG